jgi:hypothetical protein
MLLSENKAQFHRLLKQSKLKANLHASTNGISPSLPRKPAKNAAFQKSKS